MNSNYGNYLQERNGIYYFLFTVPKDQIARFGKRQIRESLRTKDRKHALIKLGPLIEKYTRMAKSRSVEAVTFNHVREASDYLGMTYNDVRQIERMPDEDAVAAYSMVINALGKVAKPNVAEAAAITGSIEIAALPVSKLLDRYKEIEPEKVQDKSEDEAKTFWRNYKTSADVFVKMMGADMDALKITKKDIVAYRTKLIARMENGDFQAAQANRYLMNLRRMMESVIGVDYDVDSINWKSPYSGVKNITGVEGKRQALNETEVVAIRENLQHSDIHDEIKAIMLIAENTGLGVRELCFVAPGDIVLDDPIPHIKIRLGKFRKKLKTNERERDLPLVGNALEVAKLYPDGFPSLRTTRQVNRVYQITRDFIMQHAPEKSFGGYRHRIAGLLRNSDCKDQTQNAVMGHSTPGMTGHYGGPVWLSRMKDALESVIPNATPSQNAETNKPFNH